MVPITEIVALINRNYIWIKINKYNNQYYLVNMSTGTTRIIVFQFVRLALQKNETTIIVIFTIYYTFRILTCN